MSEFEEHSAVDVEGTEVTDEDDHLAGAGVQGARSEGSRHSASSVALVPRQSTTGVHQSDDQPSVEDVKKAITFSNSINEAISDVVAPMREMTIHHVIKDTEQSILLKAVARVKEEFTEGRALAEIHKMYDLYKSSLTDNTLLESQCHELQEKVRQYESRHHWDPRVLKVLLIAERYRQEKAVVFDEKNDIETELLDMSMEMKHMEDVIKNKNKDLQKCHDELRKSKEVEKQIEHLELLLMKKDNELQTLQENLELHMATVKGESTHRIQGLSIATYDERKSISIERDMLQKIDHVQAEKTALRDELDEKINMLQIANRKLTRFKVEIAELGNQSREYMKSLRRKEKENSRLLNDNLKLQQRMGVLRDQLTLARSENFAITKILESCEQGSASVTHTLNMKRKESAVFQRQAAAAMKRLSELRSERDICENDNSALRKETIAKAEDLIQGQKQLSDKKMECDHLVNRLYKVEAHRNRQLELLKLTRLNTSQMVKEIAGLRHSLIFEKATVAKVEGAMIRMQNQIEALQREYLSVLEKNLLLVRNHEMTTAAIESYEQWKIHNERRIAHLMKTNIDLYTQTTSQQEIALIQNHQFHLKENEIKGLLSRLEEEDHKVERMLCKDKEKNRSIEQLHAEANTREEKIKSLKSIIESYGQLNKSLNSKVEELSNQLRQVQVKKELIRRQRDLFGAKLLQSNIDTELCQVTLRTARDRMATYSVDFYNMENDIRVLKLEIKNLRRKNKLAEGHAELIHTLRQELGQACKQLELQKCKNAILEESKMPQVHRWRGLQASDASKYEMVLKNQLLIRRLIGKTSEVARLEDLLKTKDIMYMSLRVLVSRRKDVNFSPEMYNAKAVIRKQHRQLKALTAELNISTLNVSQTEDKGAECKKRLNGMILEQARKRDQMKRCKKKEELPKIPSLPALPEIPNMKARQ